MPFSCADSRGSRSMLDEIQIHLRMELFRRNGEVRRFVVIKGHVVHAFLGHNFVPIQNQLTGIASLIKERLKREVLGRTNRLLSLIRHGPHWKRRFQQFFCCCVCIRYRGNVYTRPLPSNDRRIFTEPFPSNDKGIFTEPLPSNDKEFLLSRCLETIRGIHSDSNVIS
jgi:hypothetical protein